MGVEHLVVRLSEYRYLAGSGDRDRYGQAAAIAGAGGGDAVVDRGDGQAESEAVMGRTVAEPLERSASAGLMAGPVLATVSWLLPAMLLLLIQMSPAAARAAEPAQVSADFRAGSRPPAD